MSIILYICTVLLTQQGYHPRQPQAMTPGADHEPVAVPAI